MSLYEKVMLVRQDLSTNDLEKLCEHYANVISEMGGKIVKKENWGLRNLAYPIKKYRRAHYVMFYIDANSSALDEISRLMSINEDVIRNITLRLEEFPEGDSPMLVSSERHSYSNRSESVEKTVESDEEK
jgi:small subunit ribosomal protein S6